MELQFGEAGYINVHRTYEGARAKLEQRCDDWGIRALGEPVLGWDTWAVRNVAYQDAPPSTAMEVDQTGNARRGLARIVRQKFRGGT